MVQISEPQLVLYVFFSQLVLPDFCAVVLSKGDCQFYGQSLLYRQSELTQQVGKTESLDLVGRKPLRGKFHELGSRKTICWPVQFGGFPQ